MDINKSSPIPLVLLIVLCATIIQGEPETSQALTAPVSQVAAVEAPERLRRAPATAAPAAGGFFGGGFMQFLMQALCLQITAGGGGLGGGGLGPLLLGGLGRKRRGAGGRGRPRPRPRPNATPSRGFGSSAFGGFGSNNIGGNILAGSMFRTLGISRGQTPAQILSNPRVQTLLASNPSTRQAYSTMANQAVGGAGGGGGTGISTDQLINLVMQAMCLQQQAAAAATPLPAALTNRRPGRPGRG